MAAYVHVLFDNEGHEERVSEPLGRIMEGTPIPTLSELIAACGTHFEALVKQVGGWGLSHRLRATWRATKFGLAPLPKKRSQTYGSRSMQLTPAQTEIVRDTHRFRVVNCGRRFGKTTTAALEIAGKTVSPH